LIKCGVFFSINAVYTKHIISFPHSHWRYFLAPAPQKPESKENSASGSAGFRKWLPLAVILALAAGIFLSGAHKLISFETIALHKTALKSIVEQNIIGALLLYCAAYIAITALSIPGALIMTIAGGLLFNFWVGSAATILSATLGATLLFLIARSSLGESLRNKGGDTVQRMAAGLKADAASYMLFLRLVPVFPFALVNLAPALVGVPLKTFIWTTLIGILPGTMAFTLAASSLDGVIDERKAVFDACKSARGSNCQLSLDLSTLVSPKLLLAFAALGCIALIPIIAKRFWAKPSL
jgi:uncharacterized membrane protein YdjX (TVP38/TMEM64 family)